KVVELCDFGLKLEPDYATLYFNRAYARTLLKDTEGAIADYDKAIEYDSSYAAAYNNRGLLFGSKRSAGPAEYDRAIKDITEAIRRNPRNERYYQSRATFYQLTGHAAEAAEDNRIAASLRAGAVDVPKLKTP